MNSVNKYQAFNCLISIIMVLIILAASVCMFAFDKPLNLQEKTGTVADFINREKNLLDEFLPDNASRPPYFRIEFTDGKILEARGNAYNAIDKTLYENLSVGEEITVIYNDKPWGEGVDTIYNIEYKGKTYLCIDNVLTDHSKENKTTKIICSVIICVTVAAAICLFVLNYKRNKHKYDNVFTPTPF